MMKFCNAPRCGVVADFVADQFARPGYLRCSNCFVNKTVEEVSKMSDTPLRRNADAQPAKNR